MKYPKLKHTVLCQFLLYLPGCAFFLGIIALCCIPGDWKNNPAVFLPLLLLPGLLSIVYLVFCSGLLITSDVLFFRIRQWKKDREEYRTRKNGTDREQIRRTLVRRCARWGRRFSMKSAEAESIDLFYRHAASLTVFWSALEKRAAVCSVPTLTAEEFRALTRRARRMLSSIPDGKIRFRTKEERKAPRGYVSVIVIVADTVDDEVKKLARKPLTDEEETCVLPCVVCGEGCYYTDCTGEPYLSGMGPRPVKDMAAALIRRLVFAGRLPRENAETQPERIYEANIEMSLWEYIGTFTRELRGEKDSLERQRANAYHRLRDGELRVGDSTVWYKHGNKLAEYDVLPDEENPKRPTLLPDPVWYYQKDRGFLLSLILRNDLNRRKVRKNELEKLEARVVSRLTEQGCTVTELDEIE